MASGRARVQKTNVNDVLISFTACVVCAALGIGCTSQRGQPPALDVAWDDPIAATFEHCGDLFSQEGDANECTFTGRRERGYDMVEEKINCRQQGADVVCELRPGPGAGPDLNWMNYACDRISRKCQITARSWGSHRDTQPCLLGTTYAATQIAPSRYLRPDE